MTTIREKMLKPYVLLLIAFVLATLLAFNIGIRIYSSRLAREELRATVAGVETLLRAQVVTGLLDYLRDGDVDPPAASSLVLLRNALRITRFARYTEFLIVSATGQVLFPQSFADSFLTREVVEVAIARLAAVPANQVVAVTVGPTRYLMTHRAADSSRRGPNLVFISSAAMFAGITRGVNLILLAVMGVAGLIAVGVARQVSAGISRPIAALARHARSLGGGGFHDLPPDRSSVEIADLTASMNGMIDRLRRHDQAQKAFLQNASHELRTPLMSIGGYAEGLLNGVFTDTKDTAEIILAESNRMKQLVEELLTLSRIENRGEGVQRIPLNVCDFMKDCVLRANGLALSQGKRLSLDCDGLGVMAETDAELLRQIVLNIIANGLKYARSVVKITVTTVDGRAAIRVADDGEGIAATDLPHVFERFYRGKGGNFGLGLAIADSAAKAIGAEITARNENGAVFEVIV